MRRVRVRPCGARRSPRPRADDGWDVIPAPPSMSVHEQERPVLYDAEGFALYRTIGYEPPDEEAD